MAKKNMMKHYEFTYLTRQDMAEDEAKNLQDKLVASITEKNGTITDLPKAYKKRLAYRIKKHEAAYVNTILFQIEPMPLEKFKKETDVMAEILRGLVISYDPEKLKREIRPENGGKDNAAPVVEKPAQEIPAEPAIEKKPEEEKEVKKESKEFQAEAEKENKEEAAAKPEEEKEVKTAKPKKKTKTELRDIEQKLDEILK